MFLRLFIMVVKPVITSRKVFSAFRNKYPALAFTLNGLRSLCHPQSLYWGTYTVASATPSHSSPDGGSNARVKRVHLPSEWLGSIGGAVRGHDCIYNTTKKKADLFASPFSLAVSRTVDAVFCVRFGEDASGGHAGRALREASGAVWDPGAGGNTDRLEKRTGAYRDVA